MKIIYSLSGNKNMHSGTEGALTVPQGTLSYTKQKRLAEASLFLLQQTIMMPLF
ncbi:MAG: hypothetical protein J6C27_01720 [Clostridia bacterium]|nr:hypothetical protein [Clostridia bacterium]